MKKDKNLIEEELLEKVTGGNSFNSNKGRDTYKIERFPSKDDVIFIFGHHDKVMFRRKNSNKCSEVTIVGLGSARIAFTKEYKDYYDIKYESGNVSKMHYRDEFLIKK